MSLLRGSLASDRSGVRCTLSDSTAGSLKRKATPKPVRKIQYARHPLGTTTTRMGRAARRK